MPIQIAIVEDDQGLRESLAALINRAPRFHCVAKYGTAEAAITGIPKVQPAAALVDINLPGMSGIELVSQLKVKMPKLQLMMITMYEDCDQIFASLQAGATGYLLKRLQPVEIIQAVEQLISGGSPMSPEIARKVVTFFHKTPAAKLEVAQLTKRETEILSQLAKGYMYKEIADNAGISMETVRTHLQHIYGKLQVHSRTEAVVKFLNK
ncbi:MAG: response regulator transcription factor [Verrucomicrobia bacterium]|nr:response regulator transcription factor [Verrucomicrobiota bacterium]